MPLKKVISSGQPGVDERALILAQAAGLSTGGTCAISNEARQGLGVTYEKFNTTIIDAYMNQSRANIDTADGTLAFLTDNNVGVRKNIAYARTKNWPLSIMIPAVEHSNGEVLSLYKPLFVVCYPQQCSVAEVATFLTERHISTLNVIGGRNSSFTTDVFLEQIFKNK